MELRDADVERIGEYVRMKLPVWFPRLTETTSPELLERIVRVEEELKHQRELLERNFVFSEKRFEEINGRFEDWNGRFDGVNTRFEDVNKRFEDVNQRFDDVNQRFVMLTWFVGLIFVGLATLMSVYEFLV